MEWIKQNVGKFNIKEEIDFKDTIWGNILIEHFIEQIESDIKLLQSVSDKLKQDDELEKYYITVSQDIENLQDLISKNNTWDEIYEKINLLKFPTWPISKKIISDLKDSSKLIRDNVKKQITDLKNKIFKYSSKEAIYDIRQMHELLLSIEKIINDFDKRYKENKKEKNIIDFSDIEHFALNILTKKDENGKYIPTEVAKMYQRKFAEIAIDEYQDSNLVQEYILTTISNNNNIFMVGDVKQSIYKFRQARPELFLEKYNSYDLSEEDINECIKNTKIQLFKNFRSRESILNFTNLVFSNIMTKRLGDIDYNENEFLNKGANYEETKDNLNIAGKIELNIVDMVQDEEIEEQILEKNEVEAQIVANRIKKIFEEDYYVFDKKQGYRKATFKDIVILLRTTSNVAKIYEKELSKLDFPVFTDANSNYFETEEIQIIMSILKIIDNLDNDIPLVTVLRSPIVGFTDNELIEIRLEEKNASFFRALCSAEEKIQNIELKSKIKNFMDMVSKWQKKQEYLSLDELIWYIYEDTNYYNFVSSKPNGELRAANLRLLFEKARDYEKASFKGLHNFINYMDKMTKSQSDMGSAKLIGENENVIRIMSIHKSKGLEFPIVFLCGTGKQFNMQDLNESILLHQDIGFGPKFIDYERKIEFNTLAKEAIKIKTKIEILSEEMRLLYVALTRAKEKLIITGTEKDWEKSIKDKNENLQLYFNEFNIEKTLIEKSKSYLDWIELVYLNNKEKNIINVNVHNLKQNIEDNNMLEEKEGIKIQEQIDEELLNKIDNILNWKYKYLETTKIEGKTSVSAISKKQKEKITLSTVPKFLDGQNKITSAEKGTLMHLIMQKLNFKQTYNLEKIQELIDKLVMQEIITQNQAQYINKNKILKFVNSDIYNKIKKQAKQVYKEQPFHMSINLDNIEEKILIQGIIDLYYIDENEDIVLIDYKTDYVEECEQELINKYKSQLYMYKKAIEEALNKKVKEMYIYSTFLDKEILVN